MRLSIKKRAARVEVVVFDVDGVLTRGDIVYGPGGEWKVFNVHDGHGFKLAVRGGLKLALITGRTSESVVRRARELEVDVLMDGVKRKNLAIRELCKKMSVKPESVCFVGDDVVDLPAMAAVGFPVAVANAVEEVRDQAAWITTRRGGEGAAREVIELILKSKGLWANVLKRYVGGFDEE
ncbi:MAG TPA: hypothetical protein DCZ95_06590 [Verrucomicrobia bacterium]|nr:MAG: hypothetical protein A2X46_16065 [Lentisphaerae bacterium GWF2_57_35]HBA83745.1 hypothetical protein [Verrucomicrobiota bacterium]